MILENVVRFFPRRCLGLVAGGCWEDTDAPQQKEMWTETPMTNGKKGRPVNKDRFISKMCV